MLDWLSGASGPVPENAAHNTAMDQSYFEPPETPAHIFAVRAFRTALFGTPAPPHMQEEDEVTKHSDVPEDDQPEVEDEIAMNESKPLESKPLEVPRRRDPFASPAKGILLTPGTGATRRKSVSFGGLAKDSNAGLPGNAPDDHIVLAPTGQSERKKETGDLRRSLFRLRMISPEKKDSVASKDLPPKQDRKTETGTPTDKATAKEKDATVATDVTIDLKSPRSKSGQHWKREYQRDHDKSKLEMRKLIKYGQVAKSYANKRDREAIRLGDKLKETEERVKDMESKVSGLALQLTGARLQDDNQGRILDDLASQTAQALRYKQKADRYRLALRDSQPVSSAAGPEDAGDAQGELTTLKRVADQAEKKAADLEQGNASLKRSLARLKEEAKTSAARQQRKDERHNEQKKTLREKLAQSQEENRLLTAKVESLLKVTSPAPDPSISHNEPASATADYRPISSNRVSDSRAGLHERPNGSNGSNGSNGIGTWPLGGLKPRNAVEDLKLAVQRLDEAKRREETTSDSYLGTRTSSKPLTATRNFTPLVSASPRVKRHSSVQHAPVEILNDGGFLPTSQDIPAGKPAGRMFSDGSAPTPARSLSHSMGDSILSSGGTSSLSGRPALPADRIAAAKRRLEQRAEDKQQAKIKGKENMRP